MRQRKQRRQRTRPRLSAEMDETLRLRSLRRCSGSATGSTLRVERLCSSRNGSKGWEEKDTGLRCGKRTGRKPVPKLSSGQVGGNGWPTDPPGSTSLRPGGLSCAKAARAGAGWREGDGYTLTNRAWGTQNVRTKCPGHPPTRPCSEGGHRPGGQCLSLLAHLALSETVDCSNSGRYRRKILEFFTASASRISARWDICCAGTTSRASSLLMALRKRLVRKILLRARAVPSPASFKAATHLASIWAGKGLEYLPWYLQPGFLGHWYSRNAMSLAESNSTLLPLPLL